jgi:hypothetical protein
MNTKILQIWNSTPINIVKFLVVGLLIAWAFDTWRYYGVLGIVGLLLLIPVTMYIRNRHNYNMMYKDSINRIEVAIWGRIRDTPRWKKKEEESKDGEQQRGELE